MSSDHAQPVRVLITRAAVALHADAMRHIPEAGPLSSAPEVLQALWMRRARLALVAAFPALGEAGEVQ